MKLLKAFTVNFASLSNGMHEYDYQVDNRFLTHFEASLIEKAKIAVKLKIEKRTHLMIFHFSLSGEVEVPCDVCAEPFMLTIEGNEEIIIKFVSEPKESDEPDVIYLQFGEHTINIATMVYEAIMLSIPMRKVHPENENGDPTCDPSILKYLQHSKDSEEDSETEAPKNSIWDALKNLKNQ